MGDQLFLEDFADTTPANQPGGNPGSPLLILFLDTQLLSRHIFCLTPQRISSPILRRRGVDRSAM